MIGFTISIQLPPDPETEAQLSPDLDEPIPPDLKETENPDVPRSMSSLPYGFERGLEAERILGATDSGNGDLVLYLHCKRVERCSDRPVLGPLTFLLGH